MDGDTPIARLVPIGSRIAGLHAGIIWTSDDFDEPLPETFWVGAKDPFDRLLVAQAKSENATLVSNDHVFTKYNIDVLW